MDEFNEQIQKLLVEFCEAPGQHLSVKGFHNSCAQISIRDASDFVSAMNAKLVEPHRPRLYRAPQSCASEQFFWSGKKDVSPRKITLWIEPIITVAALSRLHFELGWPAEHLGTQSRRWGFDLCAYEEPTPASKPATSAMVIACEIKKSAVEIDVLIDLMRQFGSAPPGSIVAKSSKEKNALKKIEEMRSVTPRYFWAVGPDALNHAFAVTYVGGGKIEFARVQAADLQFKRLVG